MTNTQADQATRRFHTALGTVATRECGLHDLGKGERFVGPDGQTVYRVVTPANQHPRGWVLTRNESMTAAEVARLRTTPGAVEAGADPRDGCFTNTHGTRVHRIV